MQDFLSSDLSKEVWESKYRIESDRSILDQWNRNAIAIASVEKNKELKDKWAKIFYDLLYGFKFIPGGRIMYAAGHPAGRVSASNCYVAAIKDDSLEAIYETLAKHGLTFRSTGGIGSDISILRPYGEKIESSGGETPGATAFMDLYSMNTNTISQQGRRGALMLMMYIHHPDIEKFISIKNDPLKLKVKHANISVKITNEFMDAVINDKDFDLYWPCTIEHEKITGKTKKIHRTIKARDLWNKIIDMAHKSAEPGLVFWDQMIEFHNGEGLGLHAECTNPCGEQILPDNSSCNLGHLNLEKYINEDTKEFKFKDFCDDIKTAVRFMDNVIDYNKDRHALKDQSIRSQEERRIGLGITGLGNALIRLGIKYDTQEAIDLCEKIAKSWMETSYQASIELAKEKGHFKLFNWDGYVKSKFIQALSDKLKNQIQEFGIRNITILTIAPVGTGSIIAETSSGIEPVFSFSYDRMVKEKDGFSTKRYKVFEKIYNIMKSKYGFSDIKTPNYMITSHSIDPYFRLKMQSVWQRYCDSSISSTINLAENTKQETIKDIYEYAYKLGLKGVTVYREGSREGVLVTEQKPIVKRHPEIVNHGITFKLPIKDESNLYITVHPEEENEYLPYSIFINSNNTAINTRTMGLGILLSTVFQHISPVEKKERIKDIIENFRNIEDTSVGMWYEGKRIKSIEHAISIVLEKFINQKNQNISLKANHQKCPICGQNTFVSENGCSMCLNEECAYAGACS